MLIICMYTSIVCALMVASPSNDRLEFWNSMSNDRRVDLLSKMILCDDLVRARRDEIFR